MPYKNNDVRLEHVKQYNKEHRKERNAYNKEYMQGLSLEKKREYARKHKEQRRNILNEHKIEVFNHYGGLFCACCGESHIEFLTLDHINGGGNEHRKTIGGKSIYEWCRQNNFPEGFQVLCMNCNFSKRFNKICPHEKERRENGNLQELPN